MSDILQFLYMVTHSYGLAIILLTVLVRLILYPLTISQTRSMARMRELAPKQKALQEKYKNKPEEYQKKLMELYKENKVNPFGGCLPLLLQMPVFFALFYALRDFQFGSAGFLWLKSLSAPDPYYILPLISAASAYVQMRMTATDVQQQKWMLVGMPIFTGWISISFPAGLTLYWATSNLFSIGQQWVINRQMAQKGGTSA